MDKLINVVFLEKLGNSLAIANMSRHEGVSCDSCLKSNFRDRRYKCLICYDYDLCGNCYQEGTTSTRHSNEHPMQCILTRSDFELYYGGESIISEHPQSYTCAVCGRLGFSEPTLIEHVTTEHIETGLEVVCPICAALPGGDPNLVTDDFSGHLSLEHRNGSRDLISFLDEPAAIRHGGVRRLPHSGRNVGGQRTRRSNLHFSSASGTLTALSPSSSQSIDPIAELLQQLSGVRRNTSQSHQLHQLQMQVQLERHQASRQQLERLPRRQANIATTASNSIATNLQPPTNFDGNQRDLINASSQISVNTTILSNNVTESTSQVIPLYTEHYQLYAPKYWEEHEKFQPEQQKDAVEKLKIKMGVVTLSTLYQTLWSKDPYKCFLRVSKKQLSDFGTKTESHCQADTYVETNSNNDERARLKKSLESSSSVPEITSRKEPR